MSDEKGVTTVTAQRLCMYRGRTRSKGESFDMDDHDISGFVDRGLIRVGGAAKHEATGPSKKEMKGPSKKA